MYEAQGMFHGYMALVKVLHQNKVIDMNDVVRELGNIIDQLRKNHTDEVEVAFSMVIYDTMLGIANGIAKNDAKRRDAQGPLPGG